MYQLNFLNSNHDKKPLLTVSANYASELYRELLNNASEIFDDGIKSLNSTLLDTLEQLALSNDYYNFYDCDNGIISVATACKHEIDRLKKDNSETAVDLSDNIGYYIDNELMSNEELANYLLPKIAKDYNKNYEQKIELVKKISKKDLQKCLNML